MQLRSQWLSREEKQALVDQALTLLDHIGMKMVGATALTRLAEAGARVDFETGIARMPRELVERALAACPRRVMLAGATPEKDITLDGGSHFCISGTASHTLDWRTGEHRLSTSGDLRDAVIVADAMSEIDLIWSTVVSNDVPEADRKSVEWAILAGETGKPVKLSFDGQGDSPAELARTLFEILSGDLASFRQRPRVCFACCTASPLTINGQALDYAAELAGLGAPIIVYPMPIAGATAPVTLAGTIVLNLAEFCAAATVLEVTHPGAPVIAGCGAALLDMRSGTYAFGAVEGALMSAALTEICHDLGVPVSCPGLATDAKYSGIQAGYEKALKGLLTTISGADLITGSVGLLNGANTLYLPQIVIDDEIAAMMKRSLLEVDLSPQSVMRDAIERVGVGGHFLAERETRLSVRTGAHYIPTISTRLSYDSWHASGRREDDVARDIVEATLAARELPSPYLSDDQKAALKSTGFAI